MDAELLLNDVSEKREEWLAIKSKTIGSSEIGTIMGVNPYCTPLRLWMQKTGKLPATPDNRAMKLGRLMESFIGDMYAEDQGVALYSPNALYALREDTRMTATPDYLHLNHGEDVVECKNVSYRLASKWGEGETPDSYLCQLMWQMGVLKIDTGHIAALVGASCNEFHLRTFSYDNNLFSMMVERADDFLNYVERDIPPVAVGNDREIIESQMVLDPAEIIPLPEEAAGLCEQYESFLAERKILDAAIKELKHREDSCRAQLEQMMGTASKGIVGNYQIKCSRVHRAAYTTKPSEYVRFALINKSEE